MPPAFSYAIFYDLPAGPTGLSASRSIFENQIKLYNPTSNNLEIDCGDSEQEMTVYLFDCTGKNLKRITRGSERLIEMDVSDIENGIYYLIIENGAERAVSKKIVIQH